MAHVMARPTDDNMVIRDVYASNVHEELHLIRQIVDAYPYVAMDTEFPGVVARPVRPFPVSLSTRPSERTRWRTRPRSPGSAAGTWSTAPVRARWPAARPNGLPVVWVCRPLVSAGCSLAWKNSSAHRMMLLISPGGVPALWRPRVALACWRCGDGGAQLDLGSSSRSDSRGWLDERAVLGARVWTEPVCWTQLKP